MRRDDERRGPPAGEPPRDRVEPSVDDVAPVADEPAAIERQAEEQHAIERESVGGEAAGRDSVELLAEDLPERLREGDV